MLTSWRDDHLTEPERPGSLADGAGGWTGGWAVASTAHWENILDTSGQTESCSKTTVHRPPLGAGADIENIGRSVGGGGGWGKNEFNIGFIRILPEPWWFFCFLVVAWGPFNLREKQWFSAVNLEHLEQTFRPSKMLMLSLIWFKDSSREYFMNWNVIVCIKEFSSHLNSLIDIAFIWSLLNIVCKS